MKSHTLKISALLLLLAFMGAGCEKEEIEEPIEIKKLPLLQHPVSKGKANSFRSAAHTQFLKNVLLVMLNGG